jgi:putative copper resistance protein D
VNATDAFIIIARTLHFVACVSLTGVFAFECLVAGRALRANDTELGDGFGRRRRLIVLAWASLALALVSGAAWLAGVAANMSGEPLGALKSSTIAIVLTETRVGKDWLLRLALAVLLGACVVAWKRRARWSAAAGWAAFGLSALLLVTLAWAGHGAADEGIGGNIHLAADLLHLLAAGIWLGALVPFALMMAAAQHVGDQGAAVGIARAATRRFSAIAVTSVGVLLASGIVNTLYLSGNVPALLGTPYGQRLLLKIALFVAMLSVAAINRGRLTAQLDAGARAWQAIPQLRRNALIESAIGLGVLAIVGKLGILPPGLHTEPVWPLPFRVDLNALPTGDKILLAVFVVGFCACATLVIVAIAGRRKWLLGASLVGLIPCVALAAPPLRQAIEPAYPTTFFASPVPYDAAAVVRGAAVYAQNCAVCHGADARGDGPAAVGLPIKPTDLTKPHLFAHNVGDLYWWTGHGLGGVMPGFEGKLTPSDQWNVIQFIRAHAAGVLARSVGPKVTSAAAPQVLDFAFEIHGAQDTLSQTLQDGPVLLILYAWPVPGARLRQLAAEQRRLAAGGLTVIAVGPTKIRNSSSGGAKPPYVVGVSADVAEALTLFRSTGDGGETELMLDRNGIIRARWTASGPGSLAPPNVLVADAQRAARFAVAAPNHAGHGG